VDAAVAELALGSILRHRFYLLFVAKYTPLSKGSEAVASTHMAQAEFRRHRARGIGTALEGSLSCEQYIMSIAPPTQASHEQSIEKHLSWLDKALPLPSFRNPKIDEISGSIVETLNCQRFASSDFFFFVWRRGFSSLCDTSLLSRRATYMEPHPTCIRDPDRTGVASG
jgi:hypothetical protein